MSFVYKECNPSNLSTSLFTTSGFILLGLCDGVMLEGMKRYAANAHWMNFFV